MVFKTVCTIVAPLVNFTETQSEAEKSKVSVKKDSEVLQEEVATPLKSNEEKTGEECDEDKELSVDIKELSDNIEKSTKENKLDQSIHENKSTKEAATKEVTTLNPAHEKSTEKKNSEDKSIKDEVDDEDKRDSQLKIADDKKEDEVGRPEFETAPNVSLDESQEDHTQVNSIYFVIILSQEAFLSFLYNFLIVGNNSANNHLY